jgi:hypothetical protein
MTQHDRSLDPATSTPGILCRDAAGAYYLLTPELLAQARLAPDTGDQLAEHLATADTSGYLLPALTLLGTIGTLTQVDSIKSPRDSASGQATGKRSHLP